jgi:type IV pilus biogenesis protein PilP
MKFKHSKIASVVLSAFAFSAAHAQTAPAAPTAAHAAESAFSQLDHLNSENTLLAAEIQNAALKKKLADIEAGRDPDGAPNSAPGYGAGGRVGPAAGAAAPLVEQRPREATVELVTTSPQVNQGKPTALISLPNGGRIGAVVGSRVPGVGTITAVSVHEVLASAGGHSVSLPFDGDSQAPASLSGGNPPWSR